MSGHNKWSSIKHKKGAADAKRSKIFSKISKEITVAAKMGGTDIDSNSRLRVAVQNGKGQNMSKDVIERAINKAEKDASSFEENTFEGYAHGGIGIYVECLSDNNNRTVGSVRSAFTKFGGQLGTNGSLSFLFDRKGIFVIQILENFDMDEFELEMIDAGAEDIERNENTIIVTTAFEDFGNVSKKLAEMKIEPESQELERIPHNTILLSIDEAKKVMRLIDKLEDDDDVQNVFHNLEITEELENLL